MQVLSGDSATMSEIASPAADWVSPNYPTVGVIHRNRLWAFMKQRAYASDTGNHENHLSNNLTQAIFPGEGGSVIGAFVLKDVFSPSRKVDSFIISMTMILTQIIGIG